MEKQYEILRQLAAGEALPKADDVDQAVEQFALEVVREDGHVQLRQKLELLNPEILGSQLTDAAKSQLSALDLHWSIDSTNTYVLSLSRESRFHGYACMAEQQTAGKGRRGRHWVSPFGKNIYLSVGWRLPANTSLEGLSLAIGCGVVRAIKSVAPDLELNLKWPNDVLINGGKAGGILVELGHSDATSHAIVVGVGINLQLSEQDSEGIDQAWSTVRGVSRNALAANLLSELAACLALFTDEGFEPFQNEWNALDGMGGAEIKLISAGGEQRGISRGVGASGHLLFEVDGVVQEVNAGEISLRAI